MSSTRAYETDRINLDDDSDQEGSLSLSFSESSSDTSDNEEQADEEWAGVPVIIDPTNMSVEDAKLLEKALEDCDEISTVDICEVSIATNQFNVSLKYDIFPLSTFPDGLKKLEVLEKLAAFNSHVEYQLKGYIEIAKNGAITFKPCAEQKILKSSSIHIFNMSQEINKFFAKFCQSYLEDEIGEIFIYNGFHRYAFGTDIRYDISVSHGLFSRRCKRDDSDRLEILPRNKMIGEGAFGEVFPSEGTLKFSNDGNLIFSNKKNRVIKEEISTKFTALPTKLLMQVDYLGYKMPTMVCLADKKIHRFSVMRYIEGELFFDSIERLRAQNFSVEERCYYSLMAIKSLQVLQDHNIVHGDYKPENLIYTEKNEIVRAIDLDGSKFCHQKDRHVTFTYAYAAPEAYQSSSQTSFKSDITSLGITLSMIWNADLIEDLFDNQDKAKALSLFEKYDFNQLKLFDDVHGLSKTEKQNIYAILQQTISMKPEVRPDLEDVREVFERILLNKLITKMRGILSSDVSSSYWGIYKKMVAARIELKQLQMKITTISPEVVGILKTKLLSFLSIIPDNEMAMAFFIEMLDVHGFNKFLNHESILSKIEGVCSLFDFYYQDSLKDFQARAEKMLTTAQSICSREYARKAKNLQKKIKVAFKRCDEYLFNFDNLYLLSVKLQKESNQIEPDLIYCEEALDVLVQQYKARQMVGLFGESQANHDNTIKAEEAAPSLNLTN